MVVGEEVVRVPEGTVGGVNQGPSVQVAPVAGSLHELDTQDARVGVEVHIPVGQESRAQLGGDRLQLPGGEALSGA